MNGSPPAVWVTRPREQALRLEALLREHGFEPVAAPLLAIEPIEDETKEAQVAAALDDYAWVFFVSRSAAELAVPRLRRYRAWPPGPPVMTVGEGSAASLRDLGFAEVVFPRQGADSEAVLALPECARAAVSGRRVLIVKGEGGRALLAQTLTERGASVDTWICYRRIRPQWSDEVLAPLRERRLAAMLLTSSEGAGNLPELVPAADWPRLAEIPAVAAHPRIAAAALALGLKRVVTAPAPGDAGLVAALESLPVFQELTLVLQKVQISP
ncbi:MULTISPECIES: uroporphyrinogen-III synthase [Tepidiphilus]|uniref:Uroporphyrinogen-III synthase n=1 Tax=Tepidiphilus thermophilus TaxID=876478 RepID=A0A0K6IXG4_9PROT|nr:MULTISPECIES: uroporphyrinogen-III synthase [Tepidiphilus]MDK2797610.1 uroporphyrinogen-III synthase [Tepidiphilus sp.]CUB07778.1 Uroporphyrinogen-III synthase [Tepidiphilus thermophilus]